MHDRNTDHRSLAPVGALALAALACTGAALAQASSMPGMDMPAAAPAPAAHAFPPSVLVAAGLFVILMVVFALAELRHWTRPKGAVLGGLALLVAVYGVTDYVVHVKKRPGQSTVWDATTMDMSTMKPPVGDAPVALEKATRGPFTAQITYTGTVVALTDEDVYPRVTGRVVAVPVYNGDDVRPGQLIARLDDVELSGREREAAAATRAAAANARAAGEGVSAAEAMRRQKAVSARAANVAIDEATRMAAAAKARVAEAEKAVKEARHSAEAAGREQTMAAARISAAQADAEAARSALDNAAADLDSAQANLAYWQAEIKREKALLDQGAASTDEYQAEEAQYKAAQASTKQKQAMLAQGKSMLNSALAKIREAQADADRAAAQAAAAEAAADRMAAGVATAQAEYDAALTRVEMARADARAAGEEVNTNVAQVRVAAAQQRAMNAMTAQSVAALSVARTVRGYTEIRATSRARVLQRVVSPGVVVSPGTLLLRLAQVDRVRLQANVSGADLAQIRVGSRVWAAPADQPDRQIVAVVTSIAPASDPASRTSVVEAIVANTRRAFLPGQAVRMAIETANLLSAVTVPSAAITTRDVTAPDGTVRQVHSVWTVTEEKSSATETIYTCVMHPEIREKTPGTCPKCGMKLTPVQTGGKPVAHQIDVVIGATDGRRTQIVSGLTAGQEVVTRGLENLREGQAIQSVPWDAGGPLQLPAPATGAPAPAAAGGHSGHGK